MSHSQLSTLAVIETLLMTPLNGKLQQLHLKVKLLYLMYVSTSWRTHSCKLYLTIMNLWSQLITIASLALSARRTVTFVQETSATSASSNASLPASSCSRAFNALSQAQNVAFITSQTSIVVNYANQSMPDIKLIILN